MCESEEDPLDNVYRDVVTGIKYCKMTCEMTCLQKTVGE